MTKKQNFPLFAIVALSTLFFISKSEAAQLVAQSLGAGNAVDYFQLTCNAVGAVGTKSATLAVNSTSGVPIVGVIKRSSVSPDDYPTSVVMDSTIDGSFGNVGILAPTLPAIPSCKGLSTLQLLNCTLNKKNVQEIIANGFSSVTFDVFISKPDSAPAIYDVRASCMSGADGTGIETVSTLSALQNQ